MTANAIHPCDCLISGYSYYLSRLILTMPTTLDVVVASCLSPPSAPVPASVLTAATQDFGAVTKYGTGPTQHPLVTIEAWVPLSASFGQDRMIILAVPWNG